MFYFGCRFISDEDASGLAGDGGDDDYEPNHIHIANDEVLRSMASHGVVLSPH